MIYKQSPNVVKYSHPMFVGGPNSYKGNEIITIKTGQTVANDILIY